MSQTDSKSQTSTIILLALIVTIALCSVVACIFSFQNYYVLRTYTKQVFQSTTEALEAQNAVHKRFVEGLKLIIDNSDEFKATGYSAQVGEDGLIHVQFKRAHESNKDLIYVRSVKLPRWMFAELMCKAAVDETFKKKLKKTEVQK